MKAVAVRPSNDRPGWWLRILRELRRLRRPAPPPLPKRRVGGADTPAVGPREAEAVEKALQRWVRLQRRESKAVPARRVDSD